MEYLNRQQINPKLRQWTLGATVDLGLAVCDWLVSDFYVHISIVLSACYHWWMCLLVLILSFFIINILIFFVLIVFKFLNFNYLILFIYLLKKFFFFLFFFLFFWTVWLTGSWCSGLVSGLSLWGGRAEFRTLDHQTSRANVISNDKSSPRDLRLNAKTQFYPKASKQCYWMPHAKQLARQEHNPTY